MNCKSLFLLVFFLAFSKVGMGQIIGFEKIDDTKVSPWIPKSTLEYQYVYHFGDSEMESDFILLFGQNSYYGQIRIGKFSEDGKGWVWTYKNLTNIRIENNKFYSDQTNGEFVVYEDGRNTTKGLKVLNPWSGLAENGEYEIGTVSYPIDDYFTGKYSQASKRLLSREELTLMSKSELKIMRNEIFARYGYIFQSGGEMEKYFKAQTWYTAMHTNVNDFITDLEKENISLVQQVENEK